jgi:hypothetical protein
VRDIQLLTGLAMIALGAILAWTAVLMVVFAPWPRWLTEPRLRESRYANHVTLTDPDATEPMTWPLGTPEWSRATEAPIAGAPGSPAAEPAGVTGGRSDARPGLRA